MELSALTLRVLLLFFPGVLCAMLVDALTVHRERTPAQFLTNSFVLGLTSYLLLYLGRWFCAGTAAILDLRPPLPVTFIEALLNDKIPIVWGEIVLAAGMAVMLGITVSAGLNHKLLHRSAKKLGITRRWGGLDVWGILFDSPQTNWVIARDLQHGVAYFGWLEAFSETSANAEVLLSDVAVVESSTGTKLYECDMLYFAQDVRALSVEIVSSTPQIGVRHGRPEFPPVGKVCGGDLQPGRKEPEPQDAATEHRDRAAGSERTHAPTHQRKRKRGR